MPRFRRPISISNPVPSGGTRVNSGCGVESRGWVQSATSANTHLAKTNCHSPALRRRRGLLAQAFGLADEFLLIRSATTFGANMRRVADKLLVSLEVGLQQLLEFTERSGHWTTHPKYGQNQAERDFRAPPCSEYLSVKSSPSRQNGAHAIETQSQHGTKVDKNVNALEPNKPVRTPESQFSVDRLKNIQRRPTPQLLPAEHDKAILGRPRLGVAFEISDRCDNLWLPTAIEVGNREWANLFRFRSRKQQLWRSEFGLAWKALVGKPVQTPRVRRHS
ncbi:MAG: hypothetical protein ACI8P0_001830 [Planctomycetaceae bacterium]|jgi:hypothetical protein